MTVNEFSRTEMLLGTEGMERLERASVLVFGVGGVGSHCIEALARSGVGRLILVDSDVVSVTNINRQSIALHSTVGRYKTEVMKEKIRDISPRIRVEIQNVFVLPENIGEIMDCGADYVVDAVDTVTAKIAIVEECRKRGIPLISSMGTGNKLHPELFEITDLSKTSVCPLCRVMRRELKQRGIYSLKSALFQREAADGQKKGREEPPEGRRAVPGSISFVPPVAGLLIAGEVIRELALTEMTEKGR